MNKRLIPFALFVGLLFGCDDGGESNAGSAKGDASSSSYALPTAYASLPKKKGGACDFDRHPSQGDDRLISGWAMISAKDGTLAEAMVLGFSSNGSEKFVVSPMLKREDVAKYFNNPALIDSGFGVSLKRSEIAAGAKVTVYQVFQGALYACDVNVTL
ncbi:hypothetical protein [Herbaspirillum sp. B65]|uniref:hypothetical protein n=1 Tax=Herbaspirillum sp. B65 TaxID=137708 RepID=UPI0005CAFC88|nr:hypothetical protein [Herbaspirillum sp. B65]